MPKKPITLCSFPGCGKRHNAHSLCHGHLRQSKQPGRALTPIIRGQTSEQRFWAKVNKDGPTQANMESPCWEWTGCRNQDGYGHIAISGAVIGAHRHSFILANGPLPELPGAHAACVLHRCDNPPCVRPDHLFLGTQGENIADMMQKCRANQLRGEANGAARLTEAQVREIRTLYAAGGMSRPKIAARFGICYRTVYNLTERRSWAHLS